MPTKPLAQPQRTQSAEERPRIVSVVIECGARRYRVIDNLRELVGGEGDRCVSEARIGRKVLDLARTLEVGNA